MFKYTLLLFLVSLLLFYNYIIYVAPSPNTIPKNQLVSHQTIFKNINNGDLIFLSGDTSGERLCRWFSNCMFSHIGLLFVENNEIFVLDSDLGQKMKEGVRVQKLNDKLVKYKGIRIGAIKRINFFTENHSNRINTKEKIPTSKFINLIEKNKNVGFDNKMLTWFFGDIPVLRDIFRNKNQVFCSEFAAKCLMELEIIKKDEPTKYGPGDFYRKFDVISKYDYSKPEFFSF